METNEMMLSPLFDEVTDGICITGEGGEILYLNPAAEKMLETSLDQAKSSSLCELLCGQLSVPGIENAAAYCPLRQKGDEQKAVTFKGRYGPKLTYEWRDLHIERRERFKNLRVRCLKAEDALADSPTRHFTIIEDASAEADLEKHKEDWRSMIAHDLRSPLTNVFGILRELQDKPAGQPLEPAETHLVGTGVRACRTMLELLSLYLDVAKLDANLMPVRLEPLELSEVVRGCVEEQEGLAKQRRMEVSVQVEPALRVLADEALLPRVIQNLLNNALKYTPEGGSVTLKSEIRSSGEAALSVKDTGPGIAEEDLPNLFDRFYQAKARRAGRTQGTGLGLTFCREAMKAMKGQITVESGPQAGSAFTIVLPQAEEKP